MFLYWFEWCWSKADFATLGVTCLTFTIFIVTSLAALAPQWRYLAATGILMLVAGIFQGSFALYRWFLEWNRKRKQEPLYPV